MGENLQAAILVPPYDRVCDTKSFPRLDNMVPISELDRITSKLGQPARPDIGGIAVNFNSKNSLRDRDRLQAPTHSLSAAVLLRHGRADRSCVRCGGPTLQMRLRQVPEAARAVAGAWLALSNEGFGC